MVGNNKNYFYRDKPMFGLDIGNGSLKVSQIVSGYQDSKGMPKLQGYGTISFDGKAIKDGVIDKPEIIAARIKEMFDKQLIGDVTSRRVAMSIPSYRTFSRTINLPKMTSKDMIQAVEAEVSNYAPLPLEKLYLDWEIIETSSDAHDLMAVAIPKKVVDSYITLCKIVNLEPIIIETTMHAAVRLISQNQKTNSPTMVIDFGSRSSDISLVNNHKILVMGTVQGGGESFSKAIEEVLGVSREAAGLIKNKYGLSVSKKQKEITTALKPTLEPITKEIHRMLRYYSDRFKDYKPIEQIVILGGGANMPGLSDYLVSSLRMPVRTLDPWQYFNPNRLQTPSAADKPMFSTAAGLSLVNPIRVFA